MVTRAATSPPMADVPAFAPRSVGRPLPRVDGRLKVTGQARFTAEHRPDGMVHGVVVGSAIAKGRVASVDAAEAEALPGVVAVVTPMFCGRRSAGEHVLGVIGGGRRSGTRPAPTRWRGACAERGGSRATS